jgi:hypothetical protein
MLQEIATGSSTTGNAQQQQGMWGVGPYGSMPYNYGGGMAGQPGAMAAATGMQPYMPGYEMPYMQVISRAHELSALRCVSGFVLFAREIVACNVHALPQSHREKNDTFICTAIQLFVNFEDFLTISSSFSSSAAAGGIVITCVVVPLMFAHTHNSKNNVILKCNILKTSQTITAPFFL